MGLKVNDLLKINDVSDLIGDFTDAPWINEAVKRAPLVVVRRAPLIEDVVPVGIRGTNRSERCAAAVLYSSIVQTIMPEQLTEGKPWRTNKHIRKTHIFKTLEIVDSILEGYGMVWGPTGSAGFELASGVETVTDTSDLDIIIRVESFLSVKTAQDITEGLSKVTAKMDIQLETPKGSVALAEYARGNSPVLVRTFNGPKLVKNPWSEDEILEG